MATDWTRTAYGAALCFPVFAGNPIQDALLFVLGWVLMIIAMMGPSAFPGLVIRASDPIAPDGHGASGFAMAAYLTVWLGIGALMHGAWYLVAVLAEQSALLMLNSWLIGVLVFALAGGYQLTTSKARALQACQTCGNAPIRPGVHPHLFALYAGLYAGWHCVRCGWALMLLMFVFWPGDVLWMMAVGAIMLIDRLKLSGRSYSSPIGIALVLAALSITAAKLGFAV